MNRSRSFNLVPFLQGTALKRGAIFGFIILSALLAFEVFNYSSTLFALRDILGDLAFGPLRWATILAFAFCTIDFAGLDKQNWGAGWPPDPTGDVGISHYVQAVNISFAIYRKSDGFREFVTTFDDFFEGGAIENTPGFQMGIG